MGKQQKKYVMFGNVIGIARRRAAEEGKQRPPLRYPAQIRVRIWATNKSSA
jgi:hypothetical protein